MQDIALRAENILDYYKDSPEEWGDGLKKFRQAHDNITLFQAKLVELINAKEDREKRDAITQDEPSTSEITGSDTESLS